MTEERDGICSVLMYTVFPSSSAGIQHTVKQIEDDLVVLNTSLTEDRVAFAALMRTYRKLNDRKIPMDPNGMTRTDAKRSSIKRMNALKKKIKATVAQISVFEDAKTEVESNGMHAKSSAMTRTLRQRLARVRGIDADQIVRDLDDIAESGKDLKAGNEQVQDAMVSVWETDMDVEEAELDDFLKTFDEEEMDIEENNVEDELDLECAEEEEEEVPQRQPQRQRGAYAIAAPNQISAPVRDQAPSRQPAEPLF